jgi:hypothetical protein
LKVAFQVPVVAIVSVPPRLSLQPEMEIGWPLDWLMRVVFNPVGGILNVAATVLQVAVKLPKTFVITLMVSGAAFDTLTVEPLLDRLSSVSVVAR